MKAALDKHPILAFVLLCLLPVHVILWSALALGATPISLRPLKLPFALLPSASAFLLAWKLGGEDGVARLAARTMVRGVPYPIYALAIGSPILAGAGALLLRSLWDGHVPTADQWPALGQSLLIAPFLFAFPGVAEEYGWRGYMQERLNVAMPTIVASLFVGLTWGTWHMMDFLMGNWPSSISMVSLFYAYIMGSAVLIGGIYTRSGGSILIAMFAHFGVNAASDFMPLWTSQAGWRTPLLFIVLIWLVGLGVARTRRPPPPEDMNGTKSFRPPIHTGRDN